MAETSSQGKTVGELATPLYRQVLQVCAPDARLDKTVAEVKRLVALVQRLADAGACAWYCEGGVLARLFEEKRWRELRPDLTFAEFCDQEIGLRYRTAKYFVDMYTKAVSLGLTPERLKSVGWTKVREFLPVVSRENVDEWIARAEGSTRADLRDQVQLEKAKRTAQRTGGEPLLPLTVRVTPEQRDYIEYALEQVATVDPSRLLSRGESLDLICTEGLANRLPREKSLRWTLAHIERAYRVKLALVSEA